MSLALSLIRRSYVELDFTRMTFDPRVSFSRSSTAARYKADTSLEFVSSNVPRIDHSPLTGAVLGLLMEEQRTNLMTQSVCSDGTVGVIGSGGALPTGWNNTAPLGLTVEVLATNIDSVLGGCRLRVYGTTSSSGTFRLKCSPNYFSTVGQTYTGSIFARRTAGSDAPNLGVTTVNFGSMTSGTNGRIGTASSLAAARLFGSSATASSSALSFELRFTAANATAYDFTVEITGGQIENNSTASSYIPTTTTSVTRAVDAASFTVPERVVRLVTIYYDGTTASQTVTPGATYNIPTGTKQIMRIRGYYV